MICECELWQENYPQLQAITMSAHIHGVKYSGVLFSFCPWCGRNLTPRAADAPPEKPLRGMVWQIDEKLPTGV